MAGLEKIVTDELVREICDRLTAEGQKISNRVIWEEIGGGSMTTIAAALRRWRERRELRAEQPIERTPLPDPVAESLHDAVERLWHVAQDEAKKDLDAMTQAANERISMAIKEREETLVELQESAEELESKKVRIADLEVSREKLKVALEQLNSELQVISKRTATAEILATERACRVDDLNAELTRVHAELANLRNAHEEEINRLRAHEEHVLQRHQGELGVVRREIESERARHQKDVGQLSGDVGRAKKLISEIEGKNVRLSEQLADLKKRGTEEKQRAVETQKCLEAERDKARSEASIAIEKAAKIMGRVEALEMQIEKLM